MYPNQTAFSETLQNLSGPIKFTLLNDVVFHIAMSRAPDIILKGLLYSLLDLSPEEVISVTILNPIDFTSVLSKELILDVRVELNGSRIINIELQTYTDPFWINRSLLYLCRSFDNLNKGEDYGQIKPVIHISIMTYTLFPDHPEFYARYRLLNTKTHHPYATNFALNVLDLSQIDLATQKDKDCRLDHWAMLFLSKTWEDIKSISADSPVFKEVAESMAKSNIIPQEQYLAEAHEKWLAVNASNYNAGVIAGTQAGMQAGMQAGIKDTEARLKPQIEQLQAILKEHGIPLPDTNEAL